MSSQPGTSQPGPLQVLRQACERADAVDQWTRARGREERAEQRAAAFAAVETLVAAAEAVNGDGLGEFDTRTTAALFPLRAALRPFVSGSPTPPKDTQ